MRNTCFIVIVCILLTFLSACSYSGFLTRSLFIEKYNDSITEDYKMDVESSIVHKFDGGDKYYFFYPSSFGGDYMVVITEDTEGKIIKTGICIINSIKVEPDIVKDIFCSLLIAFKDMPKTEATALFDSLLLSDSNTYYQTQNTKKEFEGGYAELLVNDAGCGIYLT